ncbi:MAG: DUF6701 domain-containing protein [Myxococcota bacterium]
MRRGTWVAAMLLGLATGALPLAAGAGLVSFQAMDGEIDMSDSDIASARFPARRDTIPGWANWNVASTTERAYLRRSDNYRYRTWDPGAGDNAAMLFEAVFDDDPRTIDAIDVRIEVSQAYREDEIFVYAWNDRDGRYEILGRMSGTWDRMLSFSLASDPSRYLDADGRFTLFVVNQDNYGYQAYIKVDYLQIQLQTSVPHFSLDHSTTVTTCDRAEITIEKQNAEHDRDSDYMGTIEITTSTGEGTWTLVSGKGDLTDLGGGRARYVFADDDDGRVRVGLVHPSAGAVELSVTDGVYQVGAGEPTTLYFQAPGVETVRDEFDTYSYSGNNGTRSWSGDWIEVGESNGYSTDYTTVSSNRCAAGLCLRIGTPFSGYTTFSNRGARRAVDLSGASRATLTFSYLRGYVTGSGVASVQVSRDGGATFSTLATYPLTGNTSSPVAQSFDITSWISKDTQIRFVASVTNAAASIYLDDVQIRYETTCTTQDYLVIDHDGEAIHCQEEPFGVSVMTAGDIPQTTYTETITLSTGVGTGRFTSASTNQGSFSDADPTDGLASYTFVAADAGVARFGVVYAGDGSGSGTSLDLDAYEPARPSVQDDDREGLLTFSASGLVLTANPLPNPPPTIVDDPIVATVAGRPFPIHVAAHGTTSANPECGIIESYSGAMKLTLWSDYHDPTTGTRPIVVDGVGIGGRQTDATTLAVEFVNGQAKLVASYKDVGRVQLHARLESSLAASALPTGSTDAFVSRPADLLVESIARPDGSTNPGAATPDGAVFLGAGEPFRATIRVVDADGDPTPNFGREVNAEGLRLVSAELVAPAGGRNGTADDGALVNGSLLSPDKEPGVFTGSAFGFDEVGAIRLEAHVADGDYLGTGDVTGTRSGIVGRFTPSRFEVTANAPRWQSGCALGAFTWAGQPLGFVAGAEPILTVQAVNAAGGATWNYAGTWWRLTNASLANRTYSIDRGSLDVSGLPPTTQDPVVTGQTGGVGTLRFSAGDGVSVERQPSFAPFDAEIELAIDVLDLDGVAWPSNPFRVGGTQPGTGIAFDVSKRIQLGRLRFENAAGSELLDLSMRLGTQVFDGTAFVDDDDDSCSLVRETHLALVRTPATLATDPTIANQPLLAGDAGLRLSTPNAVGEVEITVDLGPGGANLPWLRFDWPEDGALDGVLDDDPRARASFGIWGGRDGVIYQREVY